MWNVAPSSRNREQPGITTQPPQSWKVAPSRRNREQPGIIISSAANDLSLSQLTTTINQNLKIINSNGGTFDDAAYLASNPSLLSNSEALSDPEAFFNTNRTAGEITPFVNFRAAAVGMRYLTTNPELINDGISASPYEAITNYLDFGQNMSTKNQ